MWALLLVMFGSGTNVSIRSGSNGYEGQLALVPNQTDI
jgi:hypothetical protein